MVLCLMVNCHTRSVRDKGISLFRVPSVRKSQGEEAEELSIERRRKWLAAISRVGLSEEIINSGRICSRHFVSGKPAANWDKFNVDWVPTLNLGHNKTVVSEKNSDLQAARSERAKVRRKRQQERALFESAAKVAKLDEEGATIDNISFDSPSLTEEISQIANDLQSASDKSKLHCQDGDLLDGITSKLEELCKITDSSTQTNEVNPEMTESSTQTEELDYMFSQPKKAPFDREDMLEDGKVLFYTGLPSATILQAVYEHVAPHVARKSLSLTKFQELVMVLMKLRLNVPYLDLAYRFEVSAPTVSRIFFTWITIMDIRLSQLIYWPERDELWRTMPQCFEFSFGKKTTVIIDCFEVFIERPTNLLARAQTFSSYKHHNTVKVLIGITPQGTISFVSKAWGGRTSDKLLTENCGILNKLVPGDLVMADRGFTVHESVAFKRAELVIPAFTKGKSQLDPIDVENTRGIANVRIHVERVIGLLRCKYTILKGTLSTDFLMSNKEQGKHHTAIAKFKESLTYDFSHLDSLFYIAQEYQALGQEEAEIQCLKYLCEALVLRCNQETNPQSLLQGHFIPFVDKINGREVNLRYATYWLGKRCLALDRFQEAADALLEVLKEARRPCQPQVASPYALPSVLHLYRDCAFALLKSGREKDCVTMCDNAMEEAQDGEYEIDLLNSDDIPSKKRIRNTNQSSQQTRKFRSCCLEILLCKAAALSQMTQSLQSLECLQRVFVALENCISSLGDEEDSNGNRELKRRKLESDYSRGVITADTQTTKCYKNKEIELERKKLHQIKSQAHLIRASVMLQLLDQEKEGLEELHQSSLCDPDNTVALFKYCTLLMKLGSRNVAASDWMKFRGLDLRTKKPFLDFQNRSNGGTDALSFYDVTQKELKSMDDLCLKYS